MERSLRTLLLSLVACAVMAGCRDSSVQVPPRKLNADQQRRVAAYLHSSAPSPGHPVKASFGGGAIRLLGSDVQPKTAERGKPLRVSHFFEVVRPVDASWKLFVHVQSATEPGILINADHIPVEGIYPTNLWQPGQIIEDAYTLQIPPDAPDELLIYLGFYRFDDRMPVDERASHDGRNRVRALRVKVGGDRPALPKYTAPRLTAPIVIDGALDDPGWKEVPSTGAFVRTGDGGKPRYRTEAKLAWDDEALYVAFEVEDEDVWAKYDTDDQPIYEEEVVEVFLDADGDGRTYNELQVSPRNVRFDAYFPARRQGMQLGWNSGMTSAVKVDGTLNDPRDTDRGWTAEMRIPVANLSNVPRWPPQPGDTWRFNLYRLEWHSNRRINEGAAFSPPLVGDFHHLPRFGVLEFR